MKKLFAFTGLFAFTFCLLPFANCTAQPPGWLWAKSAGGTVDEYGNSITSDKKGNTIVTGTFESATLSFGNYTLFNTGFTGSSDIFIVKYDSAGNVLWAKGAGGYDDELATGISADTGGYIYITGTFNSTQFLFGTTPVTNSGSVDFFIAKFSPDGSPLWAKGCIGNGVDYSSSIATDSFGDVYISGYYTSATLAFDDSSEILTNSSQFTSDIFLVKYNRSGKVLWTKTAAGTSNKNDQAKCVSTDINGNVFMTGYFKSLLLSVDTVIFSNAGLSDLFVVKYDSSGNFLHGMSAGGSGDDEGIRITPAVFGNYSVTGNFSTDTLFLSNDTLLNSGSFDIFTVMFDAAGNILWAKSAGGSYDDKVSGIVADSYGNIYLSGKFQSYFFSFGNITLTNTGSSELFIAKYEITGSASWAKNATGTGQDECNSIVIDATGKLCATGAFISPSINFGGITLINSGGFDIFHLLLTTFGDALWASSASGSGDDEIGKSVTTDKSGNVYITGTFRSPTLTFLDIELYNMGSTDVFLTKFTSSGYPVWAISAGGTSMDEVTGISIDPSGNIFITGHFKSDSIFIGDTTLRNAMTGYDEIFIAKYANNGNFIWARRAVGTSQDKSNSIATDPSGNAFITGSYWSKFLTFDTITLNRAGSGYDDIFIAKYSPAGNVVWAKSIGGENYEEGIGVAADATGNSLITGYFFSSELIVGNDTLVNNGLEDAFMIQHDPNGNPLWAKSIGGTGDEYGTGITTDTARNIYLTGVFTSPTILFNGTLLYNSGGTDYFISKYNYSGDLIWVTKGTGSNNDFSTGITTEPNGNVLLTGYFYSQFITIGTVTINNTNTTSNDIFIAKYDPSGNVIWGKGLGSNLSEQSYGITADAAGNCFVTGYYLSSPLTFDSINLYNSGNKDIFLAKMGPVIIGIDEVELHLVENQIQLFPNPSLLYAFIAYHLDEPDHVLLEVYNIAGIKVTTILDNEKQFPGEYRYIFSAPSPGIYFIVMKTNNKIETGKYLQLE